MKFDSSDLLGIVGVVFTTSALVCLMFLAARCDNASDTIRAKAITDCIQAGRAPAECRIALERR